MEETPVVPHPPSRRLSGGRRRSIILPAPGADSPVVVNGPTNDSITGGTIQEKMTDMKSRMTTLKGYADRLQEEDDTWVALLQKHNDRVKKGSEEFFKKALDENKIDRLIGGTGVRPNYIVKQAREAISKKLDTDFTVQQKQYAMVLRDLTKEENKLAASTNFGARLGKIHANHDKKDLEAKINLYNKFDKFLDKRETRKTEFYKSIGVEIKPS